MYYKEFIMKSGGTNLAGYEWETDSPDYVVCLIHGIGEYAVAYDKVAHRLQGAGIATLAFDLRGHGASPGKRGDLGEREKTLEDINTLYLHAKSKYPSASVVLYGHSLGGNIALDYRYRGKYADKFIAYIITSPWLTLVRPIPGPLYALVRTISKIVPDLTLGQGIKVEMLGNIEELKKVEKSELKHQRISAITAVQAFEIGEKLMNGSYEDIAGGTRIPMLLMHGSGDPICDVVGSRALSANKNENAEYREWQDYLHELHNGSNGSDGHEVIDVIIDWIKKR